MVGNSKLVRVAEVAKDAEHAIVRKCVMQTYVGYGKLNRLGEGVC